MNMKICTVGFTTKIPDVENTSVKYNSFFSMPMSAKIPSVTERYKVDLCSIASASLKGKM